MSMDTVGAFGVGYLVAHQEKKPKAEDYPNKKGL